MAHGWSGDRTGHLLSAPVEVMMKKNKKNAKEQPEKLVVSKETLNNLTVRTTVRTGMMKRGGDCPSWPDASCAPSQAC